MVKIRLRKMGTRGKPFYRVVVSDSRKVPTGRINESLGYYDRVVTYDAINSLPGDQPSVFVDMAGNTKVARDIQAVALVGEALVWKATLLAKQDEKDQAVELLALALGHPAIENERRNKDRAEKLLSRLETELPSNVAAVARERGRSKKLGAVVEEILT